MPTGSPDWWGAAPVSVNAAVADWSELAVRLGSPVSYSRHGRIVYTNSFDRGLAGVTRTGSNGSCNYYIVDNPTRTGGYALGYFLGGGSTTYLALRWSCLGYNGARMGFEASFSAMSANYIFELYVVFYARTHLTQAGVRFNDNSQELQYYNDAATWVTAYSGIRQRYGEPGFHSLKFVVDFSTGGYLRALLDDYEYNLSGFMSNHFSASYGNLLQYNVVVRNTSSDSLTVYVDDLVVTTEEPFTTY